MNLLIVAQNRIWLFLQSFFGLFCDQFPNNFKFSRLAPCPCFQVLLSVFKLGLQYLEFSSIFEFKNGSFKYRARSECLLKAIRVARADVAPVQYTITGGDNNTLVPQYNTWSNTNFKKIH
jgi:hypothetical protein